MTNIAALVPPPPKGERRGGRVKGQLNAVTRCLKTALMLAAEESDHCPPGKQSLAGYCLWLANERPELYVSMLARLIPVQAKIETTGPPLPPLSMNMPIDEMISNFAEKIKNPNYRAVPRLLEQDDVEVDDA